MGLMMNSAPGAASADATTMAPPSPRPHVLLVASPFQSHVNPLLRLGRRLAAKGLLVTFTTALRAGIRLDVTDRLLHVELLNGLGGVWAAEDPRFRDPYVMTRHLGACGPVALAELVGRLAAAGQPVTCVVANAFVPWALRVAAELGLPCGMLWIQSCALLSLYFHHVHALAAFPDDVATGSVTVTLPGLPDLGADDLRPLLVYSPEHDLWRGMLVADLGRARNAVSWVFVNTYDALERTAIQGLREHLPVLLPVGPLLEPDDDAGTRESSSSTPDDDNGCAQWLDAHAARSVVFVAFGSLVKNESDEVAEIAAGLAATGRPFLWVVRDDNRATLSSSALAVACAFGNRGKVVPWCAQARVLAHPAVGCFVSHCGWNSAAEMIAAGVPVVAVPRWSDQCINARFLVEVHRVGVRAPAPLTADVLRSSVEEVLGGPEAEGMAHRAARWKAEARAAVQSGGSSDQGVQVFVDQVRNAGAGR